MSPEEPQGSSSDTTELATPTTVHSFSSVSPVHGYKQGTDMSACDRCLMLCVPGAISLQLVPGLGGHAQLQNSLSRRHERPLRQISECCVHVQHDMTWLQCLTVEDNTQTWEVHLPGSNAVFMAKFCKVSALS